MRQRSIALLLVLIVSLTMMGCKGKIENYLGYDMTSLIGQNEAEALKTISEKYQYEESEVYPGTYMFKEEIAGRTWYTIFQIYEGEFIGYRKLYYYTDEEIQKKEYEEVVNRIHKQLRVQYGDPDYKNGDNTIIEEVEFPVYEEWKTEKAYIKLDDEGIYLPIYYPNENIQEGQMVVELQYQSSEVYDMIHDTDS